MSTHVSVTAENAGASAATDAPESPSSIYFSLFCFFFVFFFDSSNIFLSFDRCDVTTIFSLFVCVLV
jgi:hypothetical protein